MKAILTSLLLVCLAASMALSAPDVAKALEEKVTLNVTDQTATEALKPISDKVGVPILVDKAIDAKITAGLSELPLSRMLSTLCISKKWVWGMAYLPANPTPAQISAATSAVSDQKSQSVLIKQPDTGKASLVLASPATEALSLADLATPLGLNASIVITAAKPAPPAVGAPRPATDGGNRVASRPGSQRGTASAQGNPNGGGMFPAQPLNTPEAVRSAAQQAVGLFRSLPADQQMQLMGEIRRQWMESMTPEQRQQMFDQFRQMRGGDRQRPDGGPDQGRGRWRPQN